MSRSESRGSVGWLWGRRPAIALGTVLVGGALVWAAVAAGGGEDPGPVRGAALAASQAPEERLESTPSPEASAAQEAEPEVGEAAAGAGEAAAGAGEAAAGAGAAPEFVELPPVAMTEVADFGTRVSARVVSAERVDGQASGFGERSGPALALNIEFTNGTDEPVSMDYVVVNLYGPDGAPGSAVTGDPRSDLFHGSLAPGQSRSGVYVMRLPDPQARTARVSVSYEAEVPTVVFEGEVAS